MKFNVFSVRQLPCAIAAQLSSSPVPEQTHSSPAHGTMPTSSSRTDIHAEGNGNAKLNRLVSEVGAIKPLPIWESLTNYMEWAASDKVALLA